MNSETTDAQGPKWSTCAKMVLTSQDEGTWFTVDHVDSKTNETIGRVGTIARAYLADDESGEQYWVGHVGRMAIVFKSREQAFGWVFNHTELMKETS